MIMVNSDSKLILNEAAAEGSGAGGAGDAGLQKVGQLKK